MAVRDHDMGTRIGLRGDAAVAAFEHFQRLLVIRGNDRDLHGPRIARQGRTEQPSR
jgi:hypothetical protein